MDKCLAVLNEENNFSIFVKKLKLYVSVSKTLSGD